MLVQAETMDDLRTIARLADGLSILPASGSDIAKAIERFALSGADLGARHRAVKRAIPSSSLPAPSRAVVDIGGAFATARDNHSGSRR